MEAEVMDDPVHETESEYQGTKALAAIPPPAGVTTREEFGAIETSVQTETALAATTAMARARVEARYVMALKRPRDIDVVRQNFLKACRRPSFAKVALYRKPIGKGIEGPSIRMAEEAIRCLGNIDVEVAVTYDDPRRRKITVSVTDLEANVTFPKEILLEKTVERSKANSDGTFISVRKNSYGKNVYLVEATEDDLLVKEAALVSKAIRTSGLRLVPGDILDEAITLVRRTQADDAAKDPDAERNRIADAFAGIGVSVADLKAYMGHELSQTSPAELVDLRGIFTAIKDGEAKWADVLESRNGAPTNGSPTSKTQALKDNLKAGQ